MSTDADRRPWPTKLSFLTSEARLFVEFDDGFSGSVPFELLRVESPSAETQGHGASRPPPPRGKKTINVIGADLVGRYAVRIRFSDGHDTGLFTWPYLRELAQEADSRMKAYLRRLSEAGLSRDA
ncbi:MAG: DUF971 domain-containing protein [Alphaproteobacteria bacterium]|nr:DUF971 domain-containing protein [Alphaproteobacteria bacterium]